MPRKKKKSKNINGMGSVRQLKNKRWEYRITLPDGSPKSFTADTGEQAVERGQAFLAEYRKRPSTKVKAQDVTMEIWAARWWALHEKEVRPSTLQCDRNTKDIIVSALGPMLLQDIKATHIKALLQKKADEGKSASLITKIRGQLYQMFNDAVIDEIMPQNPVALIKQKRKTSTAGVIKEKKDSFMPAEVEAILQAQDGSWISNAITLLLFSGIREGELLALESPRVDSAGQHLDVWQSLNVVEGKSVLGEVKSGSALRHVPVARAAHASAQLLVEESKNGLLFPSRIKRVKYLGGSGFRKAYKEHMREIPGVRQLPPHCCRHTFGTMMAAAGVPAAKIQYIMGHSDYRITANIYTHIQYWMSDEAKKLLKKWGVWDGLG